MKIEKRLTTKKDSGKPSEKNETRLRRLDLILILYFIETDEITITIYSNADCDSSG